jgi:hypothetical protein
MGRDDEFSDGLQKSRECADKNGLYFYIFEGFLYLNDGMDTREATDEENIMWNILWR